MCDPVIGTAMVIGAATGAAGSAITGGDPLQGALFGAVTGAVTGGMGGFGEGSFLTSMGGGAGIMAKDVAVSATLGTITQGSALAFAGTSLLGSVAMGTLFPEPEPYDFEGYDPSAYGYSPIRYNAQHNTITGSGGRQAASVLASEIQRNRRIQRETPSDVSALSTGGVPMTGLQLA